MRELCRSRRSRAGIECNDRRETTTSSTQRGETRSIAHFDRRETWNSESGNRRERLARRRGGASSWSRMSIARCERSSRKADQLPLRLEISIKFHVKTEEYKNSTREELSLRITHYEIRIALATKQRSSLRADFTMRF